jgi:purine nucleoside permease
MEDCGVLQSLTFLAQAKKVRLDRVLVLRTGANYTLPPMGETAAQLLAQEANEDDVLSAYVPSLEAAYRVGSPVVNELVTHWEKYRDQTPTTAP